MFTGSLPMWKILPMPLPGGTVQRRRTTRVWDTRVRHLLVLLPRGLCRVDVVTRHLRVDHRTVHRKLETEGTSFSALLDAGRRALAGRYIEGSSRPLTTGSWPHSRAR